MINNSTAYPIEKLKSDIGVVYTPVEGHSYSHHASITFFKGKFYAVWSNGAVNEDDCGQRVMIAQSDDGINWQTPHPLVTPEMIGDRRTVITAAGIYTDGEIFNVYFGHYNYKEESLTDDMTRPFADADHEKRGFGYVTTKDGISFSEPRKIDISIIPNHGPQRTASGRLIISGNVMFPYTDNPNGADGFVISGIYKDAFGEDTPCDDSESIHHVTKHNGWDAPLICEGSFYQTDDGVIHMMLRSCSDMLWHTESRDDGASWSEPQRTGYTDCGSKFHFGRLEDGRFYGVSSPVPGSFRIPLSICVSEDGENFDRTYIIRDEHRQIIFDGFAKGGIYGYPHTLVHGGYMYVIYSINKEGVEVSRFSIDQLK